MQKHNYKFDKLKTTNHQQHGKQQEHLIFMTKNNKWKQNKSKPKTIENNKRSKNTYTRDRKHKMKIETIWKHKNAKDNKKPNTRDRKQTIENWNTLKTKNTDNANAKTKYPWQQNNKMTLETNWKQQKNIKNDKNRKQNTTNNSTTNERTSGTESTQLITLNIEHKTCKNNKQVNTRYKNTKLKIEQIGKQKAFQKDNYNKKPNIRNNKQKWKLNNRKQTTYKSNRNTNIRYKKQTT